MPLNWKVFKIFCCNAVAFGMKKNAYLDHVSYCFVNVVLLVGRMKDYVQIVMRLSYLLLPVMYQILAD